MSADFVPLYVETNSHIGQSNGQNGDRTRSFFIRLVDDQGYSRREQLFAPED